jgi:hypothetical protein
VYAVVFGTANFTDDMTVTAPGFDGSAGIFRVGFTLHGTNTQSGSLDAKVDAVAIVSLPNGSVQSHTIAFTDASISGQFTVPDFSIVFG